MPTNSISNPTRIIFMGTPEFAVPSLQALYKASAAHNWEIVAVVTQPDRPAGRGKKLAMSAVKEAALALGLPVLQPERLRKRPAAVAELRDLMPDLLVVAAYGLILPREILEIPAFGCINVHASLLPAYRGASPITAAILDGLIETGNSIMLMDEGTDTGPVLAQGVTPILATDTTATLSARLAQQGAELLVQTLPQWLAGDLPPIRQEELAGEPSPVRIIEKADGQIDWSLSAIYIERMTRAYAPWPSAYTSWRGQPLKIWQAEAVAGNADAGRVVQTAAGVAVGTGEGLLLLHQVQPAGKRLMDIQSLLNGAPDFVGSLLGHD